MDYSIDERLNKLVDHYSIFTSRFDNHLIEQIIIGSVLGPTQN
jgi:hypothetical protein